MCESVPNRVNERALTLARTGSLLSRIVSTSRGVDAVAALVDDDDDDDVDDPGLHGTVDSPFSIATATAVDETVTVDSTTVVGTPVVVVVVVVVVVSVDVVAAVC